MALHYYWGPESMTSEQYDEIMRRLDEAGLGHPPGRLYHASLYAEDGLHLMAIWESEDAFDAFSKTMRPIAIDVGITPVKPTISEVHNFIAAHTTS